MKKWIAGLMLLVLAAIAVAWVYQGRGLGSGTAPLDFVPADTPFVVANLEPLPRQTLEPLLAQTAELFKLYDGMLGDQRQRWQQQGDPAAHRGLAALDALTAELAGKTPQQAIEHLGVKLDSRIAFYGIGWVPVLRIELGQPQRLRELVARMERAAGAELATAMLDQQPYWTLIDRNQPVQPIAAVIDRHLVLTLAPQGADPALLRVLLGLQKPTRTLARSGELAQLNREQGYLPYLSGYVDNLRLWTSLSQSGDAMLREFSRALQVEPPELDPTCTQEMAALAAIAPRLSFGYTHFEATRNEMLTRLHLRADIADALQELRSPLPGYGARAEAAQLNFAVALQLRRLPEVVGRFADAVAAAPWQCPALAPLNAALAEAKQQINNPAVYAAAPVFSGLHAIIDELTLPAAGGLPSGRGVLLLATDNPASLIAMAKGMLPALANLELPLDASVVALPALPGLPPQLPLQLAADPQTLALAIGAGAEQNLAALLTRDPQQQPLLLAGVRSELYQLFAEAMLEGVDELPDGAEKQELERQATWLREVYRRLFERIEVRIEFTPHGVDLRQLTVMPSS